MITYLTPYYDNRDMLQEQLKSLMAMPDETLEKIEYIVVDDGSPKCPASDAVLTEFILYEFEYSAITFKLFRIEKDVPWNHIAARNIAVENSNKKNDWLMMTDMDHLVPQRTFEELLAMIEEGEIDDNTVYTFDRVDAPNHTPYKSHPHTWFMHRKVWNKFGGYDERFSGHYGMDFLARERLKAFANYEHFHLPVVRFPREVIADASTTNYQRKLPEDKAFVKTLRTKLKAEGTYEKPLTLSFPYHRVF